MNKGSFNTQQMENPAPITNCRVHTVPQARPDFGLGKDPSSRLSELQMTLKQPYTRYHDLPHKIDGVYRLYSIEASVGQFCAVGVAYTKKEAKRKASTALLHKMGYIVPEKDLLDATVTPVNVSPQILSQNAAPAASSKNKASVDIGPDFGLGKDPNSRLSELQMLRQEKYAVYRTLQDKMVNSKCVFTIEVSLNHFTATGSAFTKKEAKRRASTALLFKMGFTVPKEEQPIENGLQKQVTPPGEAVVMEEATERDSREENNLLEATADPATNSESAESLVAIIEKTQHPDDPIEQDGLKKDAEITEVGEILPDQSVENINITGTSGDTGLGIQNPEEPPFPKDTTPPGDQTLQEMLKIALASPLWAPTLEDETAEKPTEIKTPVGPGDDTEEAVTAEDTFQHLMVPERESVEEIPETSAGSSSEGHQSPSETLSPEQRDILDESINSESTENLVESLIPQDLKILVETKLPEDPAEQEGLEEVTEITQDGDILPDQSVENIFVTSGIYNPCPKDTISGGHQILEEMLNLALKSPLWVQTLEDETAEKPTEIKTPVGPEDDTVEALTAEETLGDSLTDAECAANSQSPLLWSEFRWLDSHFNTFQQLMEVPERESVEEIPETSAGSSSEGHQSPSETLSPEQRGILDESINSESAENLVESLIPQDLKILEETQLPEEPTEQEGLEEVTEITQAGDILPDQSVENIFVTSGIYNPCPKDTISGGHQILEEMLNLELKSPLWAQTLKDENEDQRTEGLHVDSEIPEASHIYDSAENISEDSYQSPEEHTCPGEICSEDHQSLDQNQDPEPASPVETKVVDGPREEEQLLAVPESTENPETVPERTAESFVIWIMMKKLFKNKADHLRPYREMLVDLLEKAALDTFVIPEGVHIKSKDIHKLGKAAARDLMYEYGGSFKEPLLAAVGTKTEEFQEKAIKHLNIRLNAFKNRPKSGLKRFFSKWDKPYY